MRRPDWDIDKLRGEEAEQWVREMRFRMLSGTVEVKRDDRALETGNIYLEYKAWTVNGWQPSALSTTKANDYAIYCWPFLIVAPPWMLKQVSKRAAALPRPAGKAECVVGSNPTKGVLVPLSQILVLLRDVAREAADERKAA